MVIFYLLIFGLVIFGGFVVSCCIVWVCDVDWNINGCSMLMGMNIFFKYEFILVCDKYDICYGCVSVFFYILCFICKFVECLVNFEF